MKLPSSMKISALPADAMVRDAGGLFLLEEAGEVDDDLPLREVMRLEHLEFAAGVADDDDFRGREHFIEGPGHEAREVRDLAKDVRLVRADQVLEVDEGVEDAEVVALPDEPLGKGDEWTLAQIVGAGLEAEPEETDLAKPRAANEVDGAFHVELVRGKEGLE